MTRRGNATSGLGVDKEGLGSTIYDIVINGDSLTDALLETRFENIYLLPTNQQLVGAEVELASADDREQKLKEALKDHDTDFVLIDCPPSLGLLTINALVAVDFVLIGAERILCFGGTVATYYCHSAGSGVLQPRPKDTRDRPNHGRQSYKPSRPSRSRSPEAFCGPCF